MRGNGTIWRAMEAARRLNLADEGAPPPTPGNATATRRALLKAMLAAGTIAALPRPARAARPGRVAIVGGGIAGLTALHYLRAAGIDAHVYEARPRIGGRMFTQRPANGPAFEVGGQLVNTDHHDIWALAKTYGLRLIDRKAEPHETLIVANGRMLPEPELADAMRGIAGQIGKDADRIDRDPRWSAAIDRLSAAAYLDRHAALLGEPWVRRLLENSIRTEFGAEPAGSSALSLLFNLPTVKGERFDVLGESDERHVIENGSAALPEAIAAAHDGTISLGKRLLSVTQSGGALRLAFLDGSHAVADQIVVAVPAGVLRQIDFRLPLPRGIPDYIDQVSNGRNEKVQAAATGAPWKTRMGLGGEFWQTDPDGDALGWDGSVHRPGGRVDPVWTWFLGGDECDDIAQAPSAQAAEFAATAEPALPGIAAATAAGPVRRTGWCRDPLTLGAYVNYAPGQLTRFGHLFAIEGETIAAQHVPGNGRIWFAGEHFSDVAWGFMNGGANSGRLAAEMILGRKLLHHAA